MRLKESSQEMLIIQDVEILDKNKLRVNKKKTKKTQIFLFDTQRRVDDYIHKIKYRQNGNFEDVPHFIVTKLGTIYQLFDTNHSSHTFGNPKVDKKMIKIAIENLGWLSKNTITGFLNNWIGDPYRSEPHIRNWRQYFFWDKYNEDQLQSLSKLCDYLCEKHDIFKQVVPSQGYLENVSNFKGIVCKSNFSNIYTDINPSFNFRIFFNNAEQNVDRLRSN
jgi:N-acetyl-anhydromuramyl-L-alanine amidase AmpD